MVQFRECIVCGLRDGASKVLSKHQRMLVFVKRGILIPAGNRCCPDHIYNQHISFDAMSQISVNKMHQLVFDTNRLQETLNDIRSILANQNAFHFDDPNSLINEDY